jgi:hypothetical protein
MNRVEIFIISKDEGTMLLKYSILGMDDRERDELTSSFLTALNKFAKEINLDIDNPDGVSLLRSGTRDVLFSSGDYIFTVLMINHEMHTLTESIPTLSRIAINIEELFEERYRISLERASKSNLYNTNEYQVFKRDIDDIINRLGAETLEMYQNFILIESVFLKVPTRLCMPLMERVSAGENVLKDFAKIIKQYPQMKVAIEKVNYEKQIIWEIFAIPTYVV